MHVSNSSAEICSDIVQMNDQQGPESRSWQNEPMKSSKIVEEPIDLFKKFVAAVSLDSLNNFLLQSELSSVVRDFYVKAPSVSQYLMRELLNHSRNEAQAETQCSNEHGCNSKRPSKTKHPDCTYRRPKSSRIQPDVAQDKQSHAAFTRSSLVGDKSVPCAPVHDKRSSGSLTMEKPLQACEGNLLEIVAEERPQGVEDQSAAYGHTTLSMGSESTLNQLKVSYGSGSTKGDAIPRQPLIALNKSSEDNQTMLHPSLQSETEQRETVLSFNRIPTDAQAPSATSLLHEAESCKSPTPIRQIGRQVQSTLSKDQIATLQTALVQPTVNGEVDKVEKTLPDRILWSPSSMEQQQPGLCNATSTQALQESGELHPTQESQAMLPSPLVEIPTLSTMVVKTVHLIYAMSRRQEVPTEIHSRILSTLQSSLSGAPATARTEEPISMWITSSSTSWSASMWINMLEAGHARSKEVTILNMIAWMGASEWYDAELEQAEKAPPPTKRGRPRKRLATIVLDKHLKEARDTMAIEDPKTANEDHHLSLDSAGIQKGILDTRRRRLIKTLQRGQTLRKLVQMTSLGILFDPDIWVYTKANKEDIDKFITLFQADSQKMELHSILDQQVELLAKEGRPDLSRFFDSLESRSIIPLKVVSSLRAEYGLEKESLPQGCLDITIERITKGISHALGKHTLYEDDSIMVNGAVELPSTALEMTDRPMFIQLGLSIPFHQKDKNGKVTPISNPLYRWRKKIDDYRCKGRIQAPKFRVYRGSYPLAE
ncbi:hypothetical protein LAWI1_G002816 [Lachnellula willkommii]|uniref:Uncharacterized protein n=1 Tax=Lachnellula willkommii TaxID=215461 RepID=A0A559MIF4_9HELO|nr:hypothetical protein LAWI1_G002816 [Lachnellula willkommii]